jgi:hypothetical protein
LGRLISGSGRLPFSKTSNQFRNFVSLLYRIHWRLGVVFSPRLSGRATELREVVGFAIAGMIIGMVGFFYADQFDRAQALAAIGAKRPFHRERR